MLLMTEKELVEKAYKLMEIILQDEELSTMPTGELVAVLGTVLYELGHKDSFKDRLKNREREV